MFLEGRAKCESESSNLTQITEHLPRVLCIVIVRGALSRTRAYIGYAPDS